MEAALRSILKDSLGEYVKGNSLQKADLSTFPLVLRDLQLNEKKVQEEFDELHESAVQLTCGKIGSIKVTPSFWGGTIDVVATNIELTLSFSPMQAMKNAAKGTQADDAYDQHQVAGQQAPPPMCPPRFCCNHDSSDKRVKGDPVYKECKSCGITLQSSYKDFQFCPPCSEKEQSCMICGKNAPKNATYQPPEVAPPPANCPPRFCCAHDSSDKRVKGDPCFKECKMCGIKLQSSYKDFQMCPPCSDKEQKCMICGSNAPASSDYMPGAPQDRPQTRPQASPERPQERSSSMMMSGHGKHPAPPPPPPMQQPWDNQPNRLPGGDPNASPADNTRSMYGARPAVSHSQNDIYASANAQQQQQQQFHTQLPPSQSQMNSRQPVGGAPWEQNRGSMSARPHTQNMAGPNHVEEGFSGFLRMVAGDIWKTCAHDNHRAWEPPDNRGGAFQGGAFRGGAAPFPGNSQGGGVRRGGA